MTRELLETFLTVVRLQSVSKAAETLYVSQSTVSHRLQVLESDLSVRLFNRQRGFKSISLTESGKAFIPLANQWLELDDTIHETLSTPSYGKVIIGSMDSLNQYLLNNIIVQIKRENPKLNLEFVSYHSQEIYSRLASGYLDIGFAFQPIHYEIDAVPMFSEPMYMIAPKGSIYPEGPVHPYDLKKSNQIFFQWNPQIRDWNNEWWDEKEPPYVKVDSTALLSTFLVEPFNWAVCPATVAESMNAAGLVEIHPFTVTPPNRICYMLQKRKPHDLAAKGLKIFMTSFYKLWENHPWHCIDP